MSEVIKVVIEGDTVDLQKELKKAMEGLEDFDRKAARSGNSLKNMSAGAGLGPLSGELQMAAGAMSAFDGKVQKAGGGLGGLMARFSSVGPAGMQAAAAAAGLAAAVAAALAATVKTAIAAGGELSDMMARTGADGRNLVILGQAFENVGSSSDKVAPALNKMQKALSGVNEDGQDTTSAFAALGLEVSTLKALDPVQAFRAVGTAINQIQDPAGRAAAAMGIFGKSGGELLSVFTDTAAWQNARDQVGTLGDSLAENAGKFDEIGDKMAGFEILIKKIGVSIAEGAVPALSKLAEMIQAVNNVGINWANPFSSQLTQRDMEQATRQAAAVAADDPEYMKSRSEEAARKLAISNKNYWDGLEREKQAARLKSDAAGTAQLEKEREKYYNQTLSAERNLQRKIAEVKSQGPASAALIDQTKDITLKAEMAGRLNERIALEKELGKVQAEAAQVKLASLKDEESGLRKNAELAEKQREATQSFTDSMQLIRSAAAPGADATKLMKDAARAAEAQKIAADTGSVVGQQEALKYLAEAEANQKKIARDLTQQSGTAGERADARAAQRAEDRQAKRDERVKDAAVAREARKEARRQVDEERASLGHKKAGGDKKDNLDFDRDRREAKAAVDKANSNMGANIKAQLEIQKEIKDFLTTKLAAA